MLDDHAKSADQSRARIARLFVDCDAGTYIRVLCEDLGRRIGMPSRMGALLRIGAGPFQLRTSVLPEQIEKNLMVCLLNPLAVLTNPRLEIDGAAARSFIHGNEVQLNADGVAGLPLDQPAHEVLVLHANVLLGSAHAFRRHGSLRLAPTRVFVNEV
jgi:tRNA pseudouridine55 synthase